MLTKFWELKILLCESLFRELKKQRLWYKDSDSSILMRSGRAQKNNEDTNEEVSFLLCLDFFFERFFIREENEGDEENKGESFENQRRQ